jgi:hypothetical protein
VPRSTLFTSAPVKNHKRLRENLLDTATSPEEYIYEILSRAARIYFNTPISPLLPDNGYRFLSENQRNFLNHEFRNL